MRVNSKCETSREGRLRGNRGSENVSLCSQPRTDCHRSVDQQADEKVSGGAAEAFWSGNCIIRRSTCQAEREERKKREARPNFVMKRLAALCQHGMHL